MARKKEPERIEINRNRIAEIAKEMFIKDGINNVNMNEIARKVDMSKSTLYVYFQNKDQIYNYITLKAMQQFHDQISNTLKGEFHTLHEIYLDICHALVDFKKCNPFSFEVIIKNISVDDVALEEEKELKEIYEIGEQINQLIIVAVTKAQQQDKTELSDFDLQTVFTIWGALYGLITLADNKEEYIQKSMGISKEEFLARSFEQLFKIGHFC